MPLGSQCHPSTCTAGHRSFSGYSISILTNRLLDWHAKDVHMCDPCGSNKSCREHDFPLHRFPAFQFVVQPGPFLNIFANLWRAGPRNRMKGVVCNVYQQPVDKETGGGPALSLEPDVMRLLGDPLWGRRSYRPRMANSAGPTASVAGKWPPQSSCPEAPIGPRCRFACNGNPPCRLDDAALTSPPLSLQALAPHVACKPQPRWGKMILSHAALTQLLQCVVVEPPS